MKHRKVVRNVWEDSRLNIVTNEDHLRLPKGCLGFLLVWKSKAAAKRAGFDTKGFVRGIVEWNKEGD